MVPTLYITIALTFAVAAVTAFSLTPLVKLLAGKVGAVDVPKDSRRMHDHPIPRLGGLAIFCGFIFSAVLFVNIDAQLRATLLGATIIVALGIVDDIVALTAKPKFAVQTAAALVPVLAGVRVEMLTNFNIFSDKPYIVFGIWGVPLTLIWIVGMTNAVNFIDGLDGLAVGVSSIGTISLMTISILVSDGNVALLAAALAGACIGFIPYNLNPAKIFMGDTGAMFLGYMLATMSIMGLFKFYAVVSFVVPFLIFGLPIFDTAFAIVRRIATGRPPMQADRGHLHHRLIDMGFSQKQAVAIMYAVSAILGLAAVLFTSSGAMKALMLVGCAMLVSVVAAHMLDTHKKNEHMQNIAIEGESGHDMLQKGDGERVQLDGAESAADTAKAGENAADGAGETETGTAAGDTSDTLATADNSDSAAIDDADATDTTYATLATTADSDTVKEGEK